MTVIRITNDEHFFLNNNFFQTLPVMTGVNFSLYFDVIVDRQRVATLRAGEETRVDLLPGMHTACFRIANGVGLHSPHVSFMVVAGRDDLLEAAVGTNSVAARWQAFPLSAPDAPTASTASTASNASAARPQPASDGIIQCPNCGASNKIEGTKPVYCEYCGSLLKGDTTPPPAPAPSDAWGRSFRSGIRAGILALIIVVVFVIVLFCLATDWMSRNSKYADLPQNAAAQDVVESSGASARRAVYEDARDW